MPYTAHGPAESECCDSESGNWSCTGERGHLDDHAAYGTDITGGPIETWPVTEQSDAQSALDLARTDRDTLRGYVAELLAHAEADRDTAARGKGGTESQDWADHYGCATALEAVASFMDGQQDGTVTRG